MLTFLVILTLPVEAQSADEDGNPMHTLVYRVNKTCGDTVQITRRKGSLVFDHISVTSCPSNFGIGKIFWLRKAYLLIIQGGSMNLMIAAIHNDPIIRNQKEWQEFEGPYCHYVVRVLGDELLYGKWKTYTAEFKTGLRDEGKLILRYNAQLGILSMQNINPLGHTIAQMELWSVDKMRLQTFVLESEK